MFNSSDSINSEEDIVDDDEEDLEIDASNFSKQSRSSPRKTQKPASRKGRQSSKYSDEDDDDNGHSEKLLLSMKELRVCIYLNKVINSVFNVLPVSGFFPDFVEFSLCDLNSFIISLSFRLYDKVW